MNRRKHFTLPALMLILAACAGGYFGIRAYNQWQTEQNAAASDAAQVSLCPLEHISQLSLAGSNGTFSFLLEGDHWYDTTDTEFPLKQSKMDTLLSALQSLTAIRSFAPGDSLAAYGLDAPAYTLTAADDQGGTVTLLFGGASGSNYYAMEQDGNTVVTVSSSFVSQLEFSQNDLVELETFPSLTEQALNSVTISYGGQTLTLMKETETVQTGDNSASADSSAQPESADSYVWYVVSLDGTRTPVESFTPASGKSVSDVLGEVTDALSYLAFQSCVSYKADSTLLSGCGLSLPSLTVNVFYTVTDGDGSTQDGSYLLSVGVQNADGAYYAVKDHSSAVNLLRADSVAAFTDAFGAFDS